VFTGIITDIGTIDYVETLPNGKAFRVRSAYPSDGIALGASIAHDGVCLTVTDKGTDADQEKPNWYTVEAWEEALRLTTAKDWKTGTNLNLERALKVGDELGGHIVTGHVDSVGEVVMSKREGDSWRVAIRARAEMAPFIAEKGSITVDGVSLTVNDVRDHEDGTCDFALNIIPHTAEVTTLGALTPGDEVNLEIDVLARYLKRMQSLAAN